MADPSSRWPGEQPDYRFSLANERTFLAWVRTSLALLAGGVAVLAVVPDLGPEALRRAVGLLLVVLSLLLSASALWRWRASERAIRQGLPLPGPTPLVLVAGGLGVVAVLVVALALA